MNDYKEIKTIYKSKYSRIFIAKKYSELADGETDDLLYAIKEYLGDSVIETKIRTEKIVSQDVENMAPISVVVPVLESVENKYLVMQYKKNGLFLGEIIDRYKTADEKMSMSLFRHISMGLLKSISILHNCYSGFEDRKGYLHMDLHPGNIFIEGITDLCDDSKYNNAIVKFIDLQNSLLLDSTGVAYRKSVGFNYSEYYSAPEVYNLNNTIFDESTDLYSIAVIINSLFEISLCENTTVSNLINSILKIGMSSSSYYRYANATGMLDALESAFELYDAFAGNDYITIADKAYYMNINHGILVEDAKIQGKYLDINSFDRSLKTLSNMLLKDRPNPEKCEYIFDYFYEIFNNSESKPNENMLIYVGMSCYNNVARTKDAAALAKKFFSNRELGKISVLDYSKTINRVSENYYDLGDIEGAIELQQRNINLLDGLYREYSKLVKNDGFAFENEELIQSYAKAHSALGRYLYSQSTDGNGINGIAELEKAMDLFGNRYWDRKISMGHILHIAAETHNQDLCNKYVGEYFEALSSDITNIDDFLMAFYSEQNSGFWDKQKDYMLLIALKIINVFCVDNISDNNIAEFINILKIIVKELGERNTIYYPVNLIYKYIGIILYNLNGNEYSDDVAIAMDKACSCDDSVKIRQDQQLNILTVMSYQIKWIINEMLGDDVANNLLLDKFLVHSGDADLGLVCYYNKAKKLQGLKDILKFT